VTDAELELLREFTIGPERGPRAGEHLTIDFTGGAVSVNAGPWTRQGAGTATGWIDNLDEGVTGTFMVYGQNTVWALRFWEVATIVERPARGVA